MKSTITKLAVAAGIILIAVFGVQLLDKSIITSAYALEQTIHANSSIRYLHFKMFIPAHDDAAKECWIELDDIGQIKNFRVNFAKWFNNGQVIVWKENKTQVWDRVKNNLENFEDESYTTKVLYFAQRYNPKGAVEYLDKLQKQGKVAVKITESLNKTEPIVVTADYLPNTYLLEGSKPAMREVFSIDKSTKLVESVKVYELKKGDYEYISKYDFQDYSKAFDTKIFSIEDEVSADVIHINRANLDIGMEQGSLTDQEIAVKLVREFFEALIAKDYAKAVKIHGYQDPNFQPQKQKDLKELNVVRIVSIGEPIIHGQPAGLSIRCTVEIEKRGQITQWQLNPVVHRVYGRPNRWIIIGGI